jgi:hypothetical protein
MKKENRLQSLTLLKESLPRSLKKMTTILQVGMVVLGFLNEPCTEYRVHY